MTWLFPLYLAGAAAILLPILLHLRRRPPKEKVVFSSLMFLEKSPEVLTKRNRLERLLLLTLRCLAVLLLALMFARPLLRGRDDLAAGKGEALAILVDASASMRRDDLWPRAVAEAERRIRDAKAADKVSVALFDQQTHRLRDFAADAAGPAARFATVSAVLKSAKPSWLATDLGKALVETAASFQTLSAAKDQAPASKRIVVISDVQEGAKLDALRGFSWPQDIEVEIVRIEAKSTDNFTLSLAATESDETADTGTSAKEGNLLRVRLANARDSRIESYSLAWAGSKLEPQTGYLPAGAARVLRAPPQPNDPKGDVLAVSGDAWDFDNRVFISPPQPREVRISYLSRQSSATVAASPLFYLTRALQPTASLRPVIEAVDRLPPAETKTKPDLIIAESASLDAATAQSLANWIEQGGMVIFLAQENAAVSELATLSSARSLAITEAAGGDYAMLGEVDAAHPLLRPFADPRLRDFTKIRFWHHRRITWRDDEPAKPQVIAKFDNGDPAMLFWPRGRGRLLALASGWQPRDSQLALSTKFVPLLFGWLEAAGFSHEKARTLTVGEPLPLDAFAAGKPVTIQQPDGKQSELQIGAQPLSAVTTMPGHHALSQDGKQRILAVNLALDEGRVHPMETTRLSELGVQLGGAAAPGSTDEAKTAAEKQRLDMTDEEARQRLWLWALAALLGILGMETWLAGRRGDAGRIAA